jgi:hypothetical protein
MLCEVCGTANPSTTGDGPVGRDQLPLGYQFLSWTCRSCTCTCPHYSDRCITCNRIRHSTLDSERLMLLRRIFGNASIQMARNNNNNRFLGSGALGMGGAMMPARSMFGIRNGNNGGGGGAIGLPNVPSGGIGQIGIGQRPPSNI